MFGPGCIPALFGLLLCAVASQQPASTDYRISTDVNLVVLGVTVSDRAGGFVSGLGRDSFHVYENGRLQQPKFFLSEDVPVTVGLIVDSSGSMRPKRPETVRAALAFANSSNPEDEMFVINFNEHVSPGLPPGEPFTGSSQKLRQALLGRPAAGRTALYDAIVAGLKHLEKGSKGKKALVVFSDGGDNASRHTFQETLDLAEQSNAVIYTIGLFDEHDEDRNPKVLKRLARVTGGEAYLPGYNRDFAEICRRIARDIRNQYSLGYVSDNQEPGYRSIKVTVESPHHGKLAVRTRTGYLPPARQDAASNAGQEAR